jgi:hypothetical protein
VDRVHTFRTAWRRPLGWNGTFTYVCGVPRVEVTWVSDLSTGRTMGSRGHMRGEENPPSKGWTGSVEWVTRCRPFVYGGILIQLAVDGCDGSCLQTTSMERRRGRLGLHKASRLFYSFLGLVQSGLPRPKPHQPLVPSFMAQS